MNIRIFLSGFVFVALVCVGIVMGGQLPGFIDLPSLVIVIGGMSCATVGSFPIKFIGDAIGDALGQGVIEDEERVLRSHHVLSKMGDFAVASGLMGTVIGLVNMLANLDDPSAIGPAMAVALLTIFYGVIIGEFLCRTLANLCLSQNNIVLERSSRRGLSSVYFTAMSLFLLLTTFFIMMLAMADF